MQVRETNLKQLIQGEKQFLTEPAHDLAPPYS